jgi:hypothetical protein
MFARGGSDPHVAQIPVNEWDCVQYSAERPRDGSEEHDLAQCVWAI